MLVTLSGVLFPLITFPYASRVLGAESIGRVNFASSFVANFLVLAGFGIPIYGIRAIAKVRDDRAALNQTFSELLVINVLASIVAVVAFGFMLLLHPRLQSDPRLFLITGVLILMNPFTFDWLFAGLEQYGAIALRSLIAKLICVALLFIMVRSAQDYLWFAAWSVLLILMSNVINWVMLRSLVTLSFRGLQFKRHLRPTFVLFVSMVAGSVYLNMNPVLLGLWRSNVEVGFYTVAYKVNFLAVTLLVTLGGVIIPRMSYYVNQRQAVEFNALAQKSVRILLIVALPLAILVGFLAPDLIHIIAGAQFAQGSVALRIIAPTVFFIATSHFLGLQILYPQHREQWVLSAILGAACLCLLANWILLPKFGIVGAAISYLLAESFVVFWEWICARKYLHADVWGHSAFAYVGNGLGLALCFAFALLLPMSSLLRVILFSGFAVVSTCSIMYLLKEDLFFTTLRKLKGLL